MAALAASASPCEAHATKGDPEANEKGDAPLCALGDAAAAWPSPADRCSEAMRRATPDEPDHGCAGGS